MSKAEKAALKAYPVINEWVGNQYGGYGDINKFSREKYLEGYHQAEKDLAMTYEDMRELYIIFAEVDVEIEFCKIDIKPKTIGYYEEVLRRFNNLKRR